MKIIAKIWGAFMILLFATLFFSIDANASTVSLVPNNESAAIQNKATLQKAINAASTGETIAIPKGTYYLSGEIMVKSNITIQGEDMYATKLYIDKGFVSPYIQIPADTGLGVSNLTMKNMSMGMNPNTVPTIDINADAVQEYGKGTALDTNKKNFSFIEISNKYSGKYNPNTPRTNKNLTFSNLILDGELKGDSGIFLGDAENVTVTNNTIKNIGAKNGISLQTSSDITIKNNTITNVGRSSIFMYLGNKNITIENNNMKDWLQRFGVLHYFQLINEGMTKEKASQTTNNDSGIYSYGPANEGIFIKNNQLSVSEGKKNPNNAVLAKYGVTNSQSIMYSAIRLPGTKDSEVIGNDVQLTSPDAYTFLDVNIKSEGTLEQGSKNIYIKQNTFAVGSSGTIMYPFRIFNAEADENGNGIIIDENTIDIQGDIWNYFKTIVEVRKGDPGLRGSIDTQSLTFINNLISVKDWPIKTSKWLYVNGCKLDVLEFWGNRFKDNTPEILDIIGSENINKTYTMKLNPYFLNYEQLANPYITGTATKDSIYKITRINDIAQANIVDGKVMMYLKPDQVKGKDRVEIKLMKENTLAERATNRAYILYFNQ
ncbi:hypothetical protein HCB25_13290 [Listeria booriae]|uniref:Rhamnogalacturonase A/B/Epimerase-like pectate lyase domain-containing protein n=1 Tax=Listeria booriae TaxID=1552123 RepID=A0A842F0I2_9LIST|nr:right-handed parallel beta-helix repeat-containing protein [Listeria booriae]MBC2245050.1 hypothetical protein [Listeria booriae]